MMKHQLVFLNLSNGIAFLDEFRQIDGFVRIQSTACEQKRWWPIILDLDYTFLFAVGLGYDVLICDASPKKEKSRAVFQGVEWIRYVLNLQWLGIEINPSVRGHNCIDYFERCFYEKRTARSGAIKKLDYVAELCRPNRIRIATVCRRTDLDGDYAALSGILKSGGVYDKR